jgi:hypothetical protein
MRWIGAVEHTYCPLTLALALRLSLCTTACTAHSAAAQRLSAAKRTTVRRRHPSIAILYEWVKHFVVPYRNRERFADIRQVCTQSRLRFDSPQMLMRTWTRTNGTQHPES